MNKLAIVVVFFMSSSISVLASDINDYGATWKSWGADAQTAYVWGVKDGGNRAMIALFSKTSNKDKIYEHVRVKTATLYDENKLIEVMTKLYSDPANSYIWLSDMIYIARDSLSGKDISKALLAARKAAIVNHELNDK